MNTYLDIIGRVYVIIHYIWSFLTYNKIEAKYDVQDVQAND